MRALLACAGSIVLLTTGCASVRLPLCPTVARSTYAPGEQAGPLGSYTASAVAARRLKAQPTSPFTATFSGSKGDVRWLLANYPQLVCAFEPTRADNPRSSYVSCVAHAPAWVTVIRSPHPENLMLPEHLYYENCIIPLGQTPS